MTNLKNTLEYTKQLNILYVEDDPEVSTNTSELLAMLFNSVDIAINGKDGLEKYLSNYQEKQVYYDLVITDINMPELTGIEMSEKILETNPSQTIVIMTAYNETNFLAMAIELGISGFLTKPLDNTQLFKVLYKVGKNISNQKYVEEHVKTVEKLNVDLSSKNEALEKKNKELEKSLRMLDTVINKKKIMTPKAKINPNKEKIEKLTEIKKDKEEFIQEQIQEIINNDLEELDEILTEIDVNLIEMIDDPNEISKDKISLFVKLFSRYAAILRYYNLFDDLGSAMENFSDTMKNNPLPESNEHIKNIFMVLESFLYMLGKWQKDISSGDRYKLLKFDLSIISDINTISNMWIRDKEDYESDANIR